MPAVLALDIGERRTGVAVGSTESGLARAHSVLRVGSRERFARQVRELVAETGAELVLVGCPMQVDGSVSPQGERIRRFVEGLSAEIGTPIVFWDEAFSSLDAQQWLLASGAGRKRRRQQEDAVAAAVFLQQYLDSQLRSARGGRPEPTAEGG